MQYVSTCGSALGCECCSGGSRIAQRLRCLSLDMAPKKSAGAKAKAKGARGKGIQALPSAPSAAVQAAVTADDECPTNAKDKALWEQLRAVERVKKTKLDWVEPDILKSRRSKDGRSVNDYLFDALSENRKGPQRKNLDAEFWATFYADFDIKAPGFKQLRRLSPDELNMPDSYWQAMLAVNHENPVKRDAGPWCDFVRNIDSIDENNLIGLMHAASTSSTVPAERSRKMLIEVAKLCGRIKAPAKFPQLWEIAMQSLESALVAQCKVSLLSKVLDRDVWMEANEDAVSLFCDKDVAARVELDVAAKREPAIEDLKTLMSSSLAQALFQKEILNGRVAFFHDTISTRLNDLEHNDWPEADLVAFRCFGTEEVQRLVASGSPMYETKNVDVSFLTGVVKYEVTSLWSRPNLFLTARARSVAVSGNQVDRLPWEQVLYGADGVPGVSERSKVPEQLLAACRRGRKVIARIVGKLGAGNTWDAMKAELQKPGNNKSIVEVDPESGLEIAFALQCVTPLAAAMMEQAVLKLLPDPALLPRMPEMGEALANLRKLRLDVKFTVAGATGQDVDALINLLQRMLSGAEVSHDASKKSSEFYQSCKERFALWCTCLERRKTRSITKMLGTPLKMLHGPQAALTMFETLEEQKGKDEDALCKLRCFKWVLTVPQIERLEGWTRELVREKKQCAISKLMLHDDAGADSKVPTPADKSAELVPSVVYGGSSKALETSSACAAVLSLLPSLSASSSSSKREMTIDEKAEAKKRKMMQIMCGARSS